jgi:hypothetical protein
MIEEDAHLPPSARPVVAVLAADWGVSGEVGWITRQVAGALALAADVHVITPEGPVEGASIDGVFTLHRLATPIDPVAGLRRDLLVDAFQATGTPSAVVGAPPVPLLLGDGLLAPWDAATAVLDRLRPERVVIAGHRSTGALRALDRHAPNVPYTLLALGTVGDDLGCAHFDPLFDHADSVLAITRSEREAIVEHHGRPESIHRIGVPLAANPSARTEPNPWVGDSSYVLVLSDVGYEDETDENHVCDLIRMRFPERPVGFAHTDAFCVWDRGRFTKGWPIERSSDLARLFAFAQVTVDLHPGTLFARRALDSMLYGAPIVVPHDSRAREHAQAGRGGLWFETTPDLLACIEALRDPMMHKSFAAQGLAYAEANYGSTGRFVDRVLAACGLQTDDDRPAVARGAKATGPASARVAPA